MALHMIRSTPNFTRSMRGYDVEEVDEYVEALRESEDEVAQTAAALESTNTMLNAEIERLRGRIAELEGCIRSETPRSIAALGERLTLMLEEAEAGAGETVRAAKEEAESLVSSARATAEEERMLSAARTADAEQRATARIASAEEMARTTETSARVRAKDIVDEAEARALARRREIEAWVERVRAHIESEEARAAEEFARVRGLRNAELSALDRRREAMFTSLEEMASSLRNIVTGAKATTSRVDSMPELGAGDPPPEAPAGDDDERPAVEASTAEPPVDAGESDRAAVAASPAFDEQRADGPASSGPPTGSFVHVGEPSEAEESAMAAFFGPDVTSAVSYDDDEAGRDDTASIPAVSNPPFDAEADAGGSIARFYGDRRGR